MKTIREHLLLFVFIVIAVPGSMLSQSLKSPGEVKILNITANFDDHTVKTQMLSREKKIHLSDEKNYLWYSLQKIIET